jgi:hypothetical protein
MAELISEILFRELEQLKSDIVQRHIQAGQVTTGRTRDSFSVRMTGEHSGVLEGAAYAGALERGRGPIKNLKETDFLDHLREWITVKGLNYGGTPEGLERLAKFLRWRINTYGTWMFRTGRTQDIFTTPIVDFSNRLSEQLGTYYMNEISNDLYNYHKGI